jgi:hypothetical protein
MLREEEVVMPDFPSFLTAPSLSSQNDFDNQNVFV